MTDDGRERVLAAVTSALQDGTGRALTEPAVMSLASDETDKASLARMFCAELASLGGTAVVVQDSAVCAAHVSQYLRERALSSIAVQSAPRALRLAAELCGFDAAPARGRSKRELAAVDCGLLDGRALLADSGSAMVVLESGEDRVLPYLPRTCLIISDLSSLYATLNSGALANLQDVALDQTRGEALIITGPSRTADIEKTLILGAHGPAALAVFILEQP